MQGMHIPFTFFIRGTLTANHQFRFKAPCDLTLEKVNASTDDATSFILDVGYATDTDAYLDGVTVTGAAATTTNFTRTDFVNSQFPHIAKDTEVTVDIDYDGGAGNDAANVLVMLWCSEG